MWIAEGSKIRDELCEDGTGEASWGDGRGRRASCIYRWERAVQVTRTRGLVYVCAYPHYGGL